MKEYIFLITVFLLSVNLFAQDVNKIVTDEKSGKPMLVGEVTREAFADTNFNWWFDSEYKLYKVDEESLEGNEELINSFNIEIVMGTWCEDSRMHVPRMMKILDLLNFPDKNLRLISVDRSKKYLNDDADSLEVEAVPEFIFYNGSEELGRIIEAPMESLEKDMLSFSRKQD